MLYDEADNLLESRMLKAGEVVDTGELLTFQAYLVDIGDPKDGSKASSEPKVEPSDQGCERKSFAVLRPNFKKSSLHCGMMFCYSNSYNFRRKVIPLEKTVP